MFISMSDEVLEQLKCVICRQYLSKLPILIRKDTGQTICGRCPIFDDETNDYVQSSVLEELVKYIEFPCKYQHLGCKKLFNPKEADQETLCPFQPFSCPLEAEKCPWTGTFSELKQHSTESHDELIIKNNAVELNFNNDFNKTYLLLFECEIFIITLKYCNFQLSYIAYYLGLNHQQIYNLNLVLSKISLRYVRVLPIICCSYFEREHILLNSYAIKENLKHSESLFGDIIVTKNYSNLTVAIRCLYCKTNGNEKISLCKGSHSICPDCSEEHKNKCDDSLMGDVFENFDFCCKNATRGCPYTSEDYKILSSHENNCIFNNDIEIKCWRRHCGTVFKEFSGSVVLHLKQCISYVEIDEVLSDWEPFPDKDLYTMTIFDNYIFTFHFEVKELNSYRIYVKLQFQKNVSQKYQFEVEFVKWDNFDAVIMIQRQRVSDAEKKYFALVDPDTITDAINNKHVYFKLRIFKI